MFTIDSIVICCIRAMGDIDLRQLTTMIAIVGKGTFSRAVNRRGDTQPSVSQHIAVLERALGADGGLTKVGEFGGLPRTVDGDHAPADFSALGSPAGIDVT